MLWFCKNERLSAKNYLSKLGKKIGKTQLCELYNEIHLLDNDE